MKEYLEIRCLDFYVNRVLELAAGLPVSWAYRFIAATGGLFRSRDTYASSFSPGVLKTAAANVRKANICPPAEAVSVIREYLFFETRYMLENIWLGKNMARKIAAAFDSESVARLRQHLHNRHYIITLPHTASNTFIGLASITSQVVVLGSGNPLKLTLAAPSPVHKTILRLYSRWLSHQEFIFVEDGNAFTQCCQALQAGKSLIITPDTPFHSEQNIGLDFLGRRTGVAAGVAVLAERCKVPILAVVPWAADCRQPYRLETSIIDAGDVASRMRKIFTFFERFIGKYPACWQGWMYWELMDHEDWLCRVERP